MTVWLRFSIRPLRAFHKFRIVTSGVKKTKYLMKS
jgi:hypothetical protein